MNLDELYFKNNFTKEDDKTNLEVNKLTIECLESKNKTFKLDELGNLRVKSISTIAPTPDIVSQAGAIYLSSNKTNPSEYLGGIWKQKRTSALFGEKELDKEEEKRNGFNHLTFTASENNALEYNIEGICEQENDPSPELPSEIQTIKGRKNLFDGLLEEGRYNNETGIKVNVTGLIRNMNPIHVESNKEYIFSNEGVGIPMNVLEYKNDNTLIKRTVILANNSFTTTPNTNYINFYKSNANEEKIQLEEGSIVHSYVPYGSWLKSKVTGKNLFDKQMEIGGINTNDGISSPNSLRLRTKDFISINENSNITITCEENYQIYIYCYDGAKKYLGLGNQVWSNFPITFIPTTNTKHIKFMIRKSDDSSLTLNDIPNIMVEESTKATEYEPYKENEVLIDMNKPNLFDLNNKIADCHISASGEIIADTVFSIHYIKVEPQKTYTILSSYKRQFVLSCYKDLPKIGSLGTARIVKNNVYFYNITIPEGYNYLAIRHGIDSATTEDNTDLKIFEGYEPYYELYSINNSKDKLKVVNGILEKRIGKIVLDGTENWGTATNSSVFYIVLHNYDNKNYHAISNKYPYATWGNGENYAVGLYKHDTWDGARLFIKDINYTLIPDFKEYLAQQYASGNPIVIYYELAEPEEIQLTQTDVPLFEDENHIILEEDIETNTEIKYKPYLSVYVWERVS